MRWFFPHAPLSLDGRLHASVAAARTEHIGSSFLELCFPRRDLIAVDVKLLRQLSQCSIPPDGGKRHLCLEARCVVPARSLNLKSPVRELDDNNKTFDGNTKWIASWNFRWNNYGGTCVINSVAVLLKVTITLPKWEDKTAADSATQLKWYKYIEALELHEKGHRQIDIGAAQEIERRLNGLRADCNSINSVANNVGQEVVRKYRAINAEYDKRTDHGATQGAVFR